MQTDPFRDQVVIVTGASAGIGQALALQLAGQGARVAAAARRAERLEQLAALSHGLPGQILPIPTDVSDEAQCQALVERTVQAFGRIDMLINNAGFATTNRLEDFPNLHLFKQVMEVNFIGAVHCTYYALPYLKQTRGRIAAVSSAAGKAPLPFNSPYSASKFALHGFLDSLRMEVKAAGVSVTIVCPWFVVSEFHESQLDKHGQPVGPRGRAIYTERMMTSERCAEIVLASAFKRKREVWIGPTKVAAWLKLLAPGFLEWITMEMFLKPAVRRVKAKS